MRHYMSKRVDLLEDLRHQPTGLAIEQCCGAIRSLEVKLVGSKAKQMHQRHMHEKANVNNDSRRFQQFMPCDYVLTTAC